jgi:hypothetical protein
MNSVEQASAGMGTKDFETPVTVDWLPQRSAAAMNSVEQASAGMGTKDFETPETRPQALPLPKGEGRGEGEPSNRQPKVADYCTSLLR